MCSWAAACSRAQAPLTCGGIAKCKGKALKLNNSCGFFKHCIELTERCGCPLRNARTALRAASVQPAPITSNCFHIYQTLKAFLQSCAFVFKSNRFILGVSGTLLQ